jgi:hypothetical protein
MLGICLWSSHCLTPLDLSSVEGVTGASEVVQPVRANKRPRNTMTVLANVTAYGELPYEWCNIINTPNPSGLVSISAKIPLIKNLSTFPMDDSLEYFLTYVVLKEPFKISVPKKGLAFEWERSGVANFRL